MLALACGGESARSGPVHGTAGGGDGSVAGSSGAGGSSAGGGVAAGAQAGMSYLPDDSNVPAAGDGRLTGGSFEGNLGSGWDFCHTKHPGAAPVEGADGSSDGTEWLAFDSQKSCTDSFACGAEGDDAQVGFWLESALPPEVPVHLYFDAINLSETSPAGVLEVDVLQNGCNTAGPLATIPLAALDLTSDWETRCVTFTPKAQVDVFGLYVAGEAFRLGLDAFRFGPECRN